MAQSGNILLGLQGDFTNRTLFAVGTAGGGTGGSVTGDDFLGVASGLSLYLAAQGADALFGTGGIAPAVGAIILPMSVERGCLFKGIAGFRRFAAGFCGVPAQEGVAVPDGVDRLKTKGSPSVSLTV